MCVCGVCVCIILNAQRDNVVNKGGVSAQREETAGCKKLLRITSRETSFSLCGKQRNGSVLFFSCLEPNDTEMQLL